MECFSASLGGTVTVKLHNKLCRRIHQRQTGTHFQNFLCLGPGFLMFNFYFPEASHAWSETGEPQQNLFGLKKNSMILLLPFPPLYHQTLVTAHHLLLAHVHPCPWGTPLTLHPKPPLPLVQAPQPLDPVQQGSFPESFLGGMLFFFLEYNNYRFIAYSFIRKKDTMPCRRATKPDGGVSVCLWSFIP